MTKVIPFARARREPDPARVEEFASTARRLKREREGSQELVERALRETPRSQWRELASRRELQTSGVVERLGELADELEKDPRRGLAVAELASRIADAIDDDEYPAITLAQIRAHAWKDKGRALCYLARYDEALGALDVALGNIEAFGALAHDRAIVSFVRAIVLQHLRRFDEAHELLGECRAVFQEHGDEPRFTKCTLAYGNLLVRRGDYAAARAALNSIVAAPDSETVAIAHCALGWCAIHLNEPQDALQHFTITAKLCGELRWSTDATRAMYGIGSALLQLGDLEAAHSHLQTARNHFLSRALIEEAGLSALEMVEIHLLRKEIEAAKFLAATVADEFAAAKLNRRAVAALAYLNDAIATSSATPEVVRSVHAYVASLRMDPTREFVAVN